MKKLWFGSVSAVLTAAGIVCGPAWADPPATTGTVAVGDSEKSVQPLSCCDDKAKGVTSPCPPTIQMDGPVLPPEPPYQEDAPFSIHNRMFISGETLIWWMKDGRINLPLATSTTDPLSTGILGVPGTFVVYGNNEVEHNAFIGARLNGGFVLDERKVWAVEGSGLWLAQDSDVFRVHGDQVPGGILARPYINARTGLGAAALVSFPSAFTGGITVESTSELWGLEVNVVRNLFRWDAISMDFLVGARYLRLEESLTVNDLFFVLPAGVAFFNGRPLPDGNAVLRTDFFETRNQFYGGQIGTRLEYRFGSFYFLGKLKVALGTNNQEVEVDGRTSLFANDTLADVTPGGLLALSTNIGSTNRDAFAAVPEASVTLGWHVTPRIRVYAGYTFIYWSDVLRPGEQLDLRVNPANLPTAPPGEFGVAGGPPVPGVLLRSNDFYVHGMNFGVALRF
jgi:hypothetical protein